MGKSRKRDDSKSPKALGPLVGAIDQGTSSSRFLVFSSHNAELITYHQVPVKTTTPREGWVEQNPMELLETVKECIEQTVINLKALDFDPADIVSIGLTNQRETTIVWDKTTGVPLHNAIVWLDTRTTQTVNDILAKLPQDPQSLMYLQNECGLPFSTYFSALKLKWLMDNCPPVKTAIEQNNLLFGTVDSWLIWNLTGGRSGGIHMTDVTNASRTMLMNISSLEWDPYLCRFFRIPMTILPEIRSSSEVYGSLAVTSLQGVPIAGCLGDQQAALVGQSCFRPGQAKNTYGTGCFMLFNIGPKVVYSTHGLLSTVAYKFGNEEACYALEGSVAIAGAATAWLRDNLGLFENKEDMETLAREVHNIGDQVNTSGDGDTGDVYFVPAFSGLFAPYWRPDARGVIVGITQFTRKQHICRAALEAVCFQTKEILTAMEKDSKLSLGTLLVDGGMSQNNLLMEIQADFLGIPILRPTMSETTALGAAIAAGRAEGIDTWDIGSMSDVTLEKFLPRLTQDQREIRFDRWKQAVERSFGWNVPHADHGGMSDASYRLYASIPGTLFLFTAFVIYKMADSIASS